MKRKLDFIFTTLIGLLGIVHVSLTPMFYDSMNGDASIFIGMGLAFIFLSALNLTRILANIKSATVISLISNFLGLIYLVYCAVIRGAVESQFLITILTVFIVLTFSVLQLKGIQSAKNDTI